MRRRILALDDAFSPNELEKLLRSAQDTATPLSFLVDTVTQHDARLLDELERVVDRKRQELKKGRKR